MRKHHNKLFYGTYTHKTVFKMPWAHQLFPTTDENLIKYVKGQKHFYGKQHPALIDLAVYIMENRHNIKFRVQKDHTLFYSDFETAVEIITKYWKYFIDVVSINLAHTNKLQKNIITCKRYPHKDFRYQIYLKKDIHQILDDNERQSFIQFCKRNKENIKITSKYINDFISGKTPYCWYGYFYVKEEKFLSPLYIIMKRAIDKVQRYIKI